MEDQETTKTEPVLPKRMKRDEWCEYCEQKMELFAAFPKKDKSAIEVWYRCKCTKPRGFAYDGGFVEAYNKIKKVLPT